MSNLIVIGNGFDMAHGLKTSYSSFIEFMVNQKYKDEKLYSDLFEFTSLTRNSFKSYEELKKGDKRHHPFQTKNLLFKRLSNMLMNLNWCDIEQSYFNELTRIGKSGGYQTPTELNNDFHIIKSYLLSYLENEQNRLKPMKVFTDLFNQIGMDPSLILNFNYTNTVSKHYNKANKTEQVQIHGALKSDENPVIFGYAADDNESRKLLGLNDKEFLRNIKKHNYKRTNEEDKLNRFLINNRDIEVWIIGHSCGLSDKLILNNVLNDDHVNGIRIFYHRNHEHFFETQVNIDRIMNNDSNFEKLTSFQESFIIPQIKLPDNHSEFSKNVNQMIGKNKEQINLKYSQVY